MADNAGGPETTAAAAVTTAEISAALAGMTRSTPDGFSAELLREAVAGSEYVAKFVADAATLALRGDFPQRWRTVDVRALQKPGRPRGPTGSLRPVGDIPILRAVIERVWARRFAEVVEPGLHDAQCGFRPGRSDDLASLALMDFVATAQVKTARAPRTAAGAGAVRRHRTLIVATDIKDAYPSLDPRRLAAALRERAPDLARWAENATGDKSIRVHFGSEVAQPVPTAAGTTTGAADAPCMWTAYMDELLQRLHDAAVSRSRDGVEALAVAVADDLTIAVAGPSVEAIAAAARVLLNIVTRWAASANLQISPKSKALLVRPFSKKADKTAEARPEWVLATGKPVPPSSAAVSTSRSSRRVLRCASSGSNTTRSAASTRTARQ